MKQQNQPDIAWKKLDQPDLEKKIKIETKLSGKIL
jgi:hypothetical protein